MSDDFVRIVNTFANLASTFCMVALLVVIGVLRKDAVRLRRQQVRMMGMFSESKTEEEDKDETTP